MPHYIVRTLFVLFVLSGCQKEIKTTSACEEIKIGIPDLPKASKLSQIMKDVHLIPLETTEECLLIHPIQLEIFDESIFIRNMSHEDGIFVFNMEGEFQHTIGKHGKGPGEHTRLQSFSLLPDENRIYINDSWGRKIIEYDLKGNFISEIKTPIRFGDVKFLNPNKYYLHYPKEYYLRLIDTKKSEISTFIPHVNGCDQYGPAIETQADGSFLYSPSFHDSVYSLEEDTILLKYAFDFGNYNFSGEDQMAESRKNNRTSYPPKRLWLAGRYFDLGNLFHFALFVDDRSERYNIDPFLWDKKSQTLTRLDDNSDDILFGSSYDITSVSPEGEWISAQGALELIESRDKIAQNKNFKYPDGFINQVDNLKEDDNPVLVFYTMK